jgi:hypothetical protein
VTELALPSPAPPAPVPTASAAAGGVIPAIVAGAGERAARRFLEFFAATIRNPNTRAAYFRAATPRARARPRGVRPTRQYGGQDDWR